MIASVPGVSRRGRIIEGLLSGEAGEGEAGEDNEQMDAACLEHAPRAAGRRLACESGGEHAEPQPGRQRADDVRPGKERAEQERPDNETGGAERDGARG